MSTQSSTMGTEESEDSSLSVSQMFSLGNKISFVKLGDDNFLLWKFKVITTLEGYNLEKFLEWESKPPLKFIMIASETNVVTTTDASSTRIQAPNPDYKKWKRQDLLVSSWLLGPMSKDILNQMLHCSDILNQMLHCSSTKEIWTTLQEIDSARSLAQAMQFNNKL